MKLTEIAVRESARQEAEWRERVAEVARKKAEQAAREAKFAAAFEDWLKRTYDIDEFDDPAAEVIAAEVSSGMLNVKLRLTDGEVWPNNVMCYGDADGSPTKLTAIRSWGARYWDGVSSYKVTDFPTFPEALLWVYEHVKCGPFAAHDEPEEGAA